MYLILKLFVVMVLIIQFKLEWKKGSCCSDISELHISRTSPIIITTQLSSYYFSTGIILIHNPLFQLIRVSDQEKRKIIILFNDQVPNDQLRLLHLLMPQDVV